jgi:hypothetical protein
MGERLGDDDLKDLAQRQATGGPQPGEVYRHYRGGIYSIVARCIKEDTLEPLVVYHSNKEGTNWARTLADFTEVCDVEMTAQDRSRYTARVKRSTRLGD